MAGSVNKVILIGNVGKDPEVRTTQDGTQDRQLLAGHQRDLERPGVAASARSAPSGTAWWCSTTASARSSRNTCARARKVYVEGALQTRKWTDQSGQEKYTTEVVIGRFRGELTLLDGRGEGEGRRAKAARGNRRRARRRLAPGRPRGGAVVGCAEGRR